MTAKPMPAPAGDDETLREAIAAANIPALLPVLVQLTGDLTWLEDPFRPVREGGLSDNDTGGLPEDVQWSIRDAAYESISSWQAGAPVALPLPSEELLVRMLGVAMGETIPPEYGPMIRADLARSGATVALEAARPTPELDVEGFSVVVVGAGISGIGAAMALDELGVDYTILERNSAMGGTWWDNSYPGAGVDTPSHLYSYAGIPHDWKHYFSFRDDVREYLERISSERHLTEHIRFDSTVESAEYDEASQAWAVAVRQGDGQRYTLRANVLLSAVGAFNSPKTPDIPGLDDFRGEVFHTARWPAGADLRGGSIAVVGTGASAMQVVPILAETVERLSIFQRSPQWAAPFTKFRTPVPDAVRWLLRTLPLYAFWYRAGLHWVFNDRIHGALQKDPEWPEPERSLNRINDRHREYFTEYIVAELGDRQDLLPWVLPDYPPFGKRMLLDNGWYRTLRKDNVELVPHAVAKVTATGLVDERAGVHDADAIVLATGFDVVNFLSTMDIVGRDGVRLHEVWGEDNARAYLGCAIPGFPNLFSLYGPNTQPGHGGSFIWTIEAQVRYITGLLRRMLIEGIGSLECRQDVHDRYNASVEEAHEHMIWTHPGMSTYYRNARGRVVVTCPFRNIDYWYMTRRSNLDDYIAVPRKDRAR